MEKKVLLGMSGGVDSSVSALLLKEQGYTVVGITFVLADKEGADVGLENTDVRDARAVCEKIGIEHHALDLRQRFRTEVMDRFADAYDSGITPNPCVDCNREIKFHTLMEEADRLGCQYVSTGHYACVRQDPDTGRYYLTKAVQDKKDQSYVLYSLSQELLARLVLPLSELSKEEVRAFAAKHGLQVANKADSQDICFIPDGDHVAFLEEYTGSTGTPGNFVDQSGQVLGCHQGIWRYTVGQRKGLGITFGKPMFVGKIYGDSGDVLLIENDDLFLRDMTVGNVYYMAMDKCDGPFRAQVKIRYSHKGADATVSPTENGKLHILFDEPQRAITPGQAAVFYDGDKVLGGGTIVE